MWFLRQYIQFSVLDLQTEHCKWVKLNYQSIPKFEAIVGLLKYKIFLETSYKETFLLLLLKHSTSYGKLIIP